MLYGWEWVIPEAQLQLIHSPSLTPLAPLHRALLLSLKNTCSVQVLSLTFFNTDLLIYICLTDPCHSLCWRIICMAVRSLICISFSLHFCLPLPYTSPEPFFTPSSPLWRFTAQQDESQLCLLLWLLLRSMLAISGKPITHKTCTLSRLVTNLAQHARAPVALSSGIRKN